MSQKSFCYTLLLLIFSVTLYGKKIPLFHLDVENGLPSNTIYSITLQNNGYLWFSTNKGLSRFNGINFQNFSSFDNLPDNDILNTTEDGDGRLWLSSFGGYLCFYKDDTFHSAKNTPWLNLPFSSPLLRSHTQKDGSINIVISDQTKFINIIDNNIRVIPIKISTPLNLLSVKTINRDTFELTYSDHTARIDSSGKQFTSKYYKIKDEHFLIFSNSRKDTNQYYGTPRGIYTLNEQLLLPLKKTTINLIYEVPTSISKNNFIVGFLDKLTINDSTSINIGGHVSYIIKDVDDNFWISTLSDGVYYLSKYYNEMEEYDSVYNEKVVYAKLLNNILYFVTNNGSLYLKKKDEVKCIYRSNEHNSYYTKSNFLITDQGDFIKVIDSKFYFYKNISQNNLIGSPIIKNAASRMIKEMLQDNDNIYITNIFNIQNFNRDSLLKFPNLPFDSLIDFKTIPFRIYSRAIDPSDRSLWYSQKKKISKIVNGENDAQSQFPEITFTSMSFSGNYLVTISDNNILNVYNNYQTNKIRSSTIALPNCIWENIIPINNNCVLISTNNYYRLLTLLPPNKNGDPQFTIETVESPFLPRQAEYIVSDSVNSYFLKKGTITLIPTKLFFGKTKPPIPIFASLKTLKKKYAIESAIHVSYDESRTISIQIDNISFSSKELLTQYSISQDDNDNWNIMSGGAINIATPTYGKYVIKVRSKTISSNYSKPIIFTLIIEKPFWAKWWFVLLISLVLITLIYLVITLLYRRKLRKKQKEHDVEFKYQQSEYKALNALMNPHFVFNSLNNIQGLINKDDKETANQYLVIFANLIRQNMKNVSLGLISLEQEMHLVGNYLHLEKLRFKDLVNFEVIIDEEVEMDNIMIPPLLIQPLVENAVLHGLLPLQSINSKVTIKVYEEADIVHISIKDNGIGLTKSLNSKAKGRDSYGLQNLNSRIEHLKKFQKLEINFNIQELAGEEGNVSGTESSITIHL